MKRNFYKVFGQPNDGMAELLFRYISNCRVDPRQLDYINEVKAKDKLKKTTIDDFDTQNDINKMRVNFWTFIQKFDAIWHKKQPVARSQEPSVIEQ